MKASKDTPNISGRGGGGGGARRLLFDEGNGTRTLALGLEKEWLNKLTQSECTIKRRGEDLEGKTTRKGFEVRNSRISVDRKSVLDFTPAIGRMKKKKGGPDASSLILITMVTCRCHGRSSKMKFSCGFILEVKEKKAGHDGRNASTLAAAEGKDRESKKKVAILE